MNGVKAELETANTKLSETASELETYKNYKLEIETAEKKNVINKYAAKLSEEIIATYNANIENYTITDLEKDLSYELVKATPSLFSLEGSPMLPKETRVTGIEAILEKYK